MASTPIAVDRAGKFEKVCGILDHHARPAGKADSNPAGNPA